MFVVKTTFITQIQKRSLALIVYFITSFGVSDYSLRQANDKLLKDVNVMWSSEPHISIELHVIRAVARALIGGGGGGGGGVYSYIRDLPD